MKTLKFNLLNKNITKDIESPTVVDQHTFWQYYIKLLQIKIGDLLTPGEEAVVAWLLANDPYKSWFLKPNSEIAMQELNLNYPNFQRIKRDLAEKKIIVATNPDLKKQIDYLLHPGLRNFQMQMQKTFKDETEVEFKFPFRITVKGSD